MNLTVKHVERIPMSVPFREVPAREILGGDRAAQIGDRDRLRLFPHVHDTDGFFAAVLRRISEGKAGPAVPVVAPSPKRTVDRGNILPPPAWSRQA